MYEFMYITATKTATTTTTTTTTTITTTTTTIIATTTTITTTITTTTTTITTTTTTRTKIVNRNAFSNVDNVFVDTQVDYVDVVDDACNRSDHNAVLYALSQVGVVDEAKQSKQSSSIVLCNQPWVKYVWSDIAKARYYADRGVLLLNLLFNVQRLDDSSLDVDWLYESVVFAL